MEPLEEYQEIEDLKHNNIVIISKNSKIIYKIYNKMLILIKSAYKTLDHTNFNLILTACMKQLNKEGTLYGFEKKELAISICMLLLDAIGYPEIISAFSVGVIANLIENIYTHNMHRYKQNKKCVIF